MFCHIKLSGIFIFLLDYIKMLYILGANLLWKTAGVVKLVDTPDLGSGGFAVRVRVSPSAPFRGFEDFF